MSLDGVVVVDKPAGPTSHDVVLGVRRALGERRVGHAGTLDPFATGVLACCLGRATRLARFLAACDKVYEGVLRLGFATDTGDPTGRPLASPVEPAATLEQLREGAARLTGEIPQVPPLYSAKKRGGVPLHRLARRGEDVPREPVRVRVGSFEVLSLADGRAAFRVACSAGTYVRALAADLGALVGCPAHLEELRRVEAGPFTLEGAVPGDALLREELLARLVPLDRVPLPLPGAVLAAESLAAFGHGRALRGDAWRAEGEAPAPGSRVAVRSAAGGLLGVAVVEAGGALRPEVVLAAAG